MGAFDQQENGLHCTSRNNIQTTSAVWFTENRCTFLSSIVETVEQYSIPFELILNADQTPSSYVSVGKMTMAKRGEKSVPIKRLTDKRNITLTFAVTFAGDFLPMQIIYGGKTDRSQPRGVVFPKGFHVTQNEKHLVQ